MNLNEISQRIQAQLAASKGGRSYFGGPARTRGEVAELQRQLNANASWERKDAIKRVIANMTIGKDVSGLLPSVLKNMQTEDLEQKKLVYLYLINYAKTQPELVILAVNTFVKDTDDSNPLIRALAIRTMGMLRADKIMDYISDPLRKCLRDDNPYVRKTAALCVAKLYDMKPDLATENGFITMLQDMLGDSNPMVVANAVTALAEVEDANAEETGEKGAIFKLDSDLLVKLLVALGECTEWGRIAILTAIAKYRAKDEKEAEHICERVVPQFQHANGSVVLAAVKVILVHLRSIQREDFVRIITRKMAPPLVTLVSSPPEIQWVALRNINLILQKRPDVLSNEMRVFFCKYNDPSYVKLEKLDIMIKLASEKNIDALLSELKEYASEVDYDFVRKAIRAIGQCAIKIDGAAERCINVLLDLIATRVSYVVQEAIIVIKDIFRKYPQRYEGIIPTLCSSLEDLDEPEAKASLIWILGEYAQKIDNADELLRTFLGTFAEEAPQVQLQILTAIVKLYLKRPESASDLVQSVLQASTKNCDNPDIRDRAYIYWRLLSSDADAAKAAILAQRPQISIALSTIAPALLDELTSEICTLAAVYHKPVEAFIGRGRLGADELAKKGQAAAMDAEAGLSNEGAIAALHTVAQGQRSENLLDFGPDDEGETNTLGAAVQQAALEGLTIGSSRPSAAQQMPKTTANPLDDLMGLFDSAGLGPASTPVQPAKPPTQNGHTSDPFGGLNFGSSPAMASLQPAQSQAKTSNNDLLGDLL